MGYCNNEESAKSLNVTDFVTEAESQGFKIGWQQKTGEEPDIIMFRSDGLILHICTCRQRVARAVIYGEVPIGEKSKRKWVGVGADGVFAFVKSVKSEFKDF